MKTKILAPLLFFFTVNSSQAQTSIYHPFPDTNAVWRVDQYDDCSQGMQDFRLHFMTRCQLMKADTLIVGKKHIRVHEQNIDLCLRKPYDGELYLLIEDKKVFINFPTKKYDQLLYDFSLQKGDTVYSRQALGFKPIVTDIDSILIDGTYRKRWIIDAPNMGIYTTIIEGIGSTNGLTELFFRNKDVHSDLVCFSQNGKSLYPNPNANCEPPSLGINNEVTTTLLISMFPNPLISESTLTFPAQIYTRLEVYDMLGRKVYAQILTSESEITLSKSLFTQSGCYCYRLLRADGSFISNKFIVY